MEFLKKGILNPYIPFFSIDMSQHSKGILGCFYKRISLYKFTITFHQIKFALSNFT